MSDKILYGNFGMMPLSIAKVKKNMESAKR